MTDTSRIAKSFYRHPKVRLARELEPGSIALWLMMNCYCRDHRRQGRFSVDEAREFGTDAEIKALVDCRLWQECDGQIEFHDWSDWNADLIGAGIKTTSRRMVHDVLPDHPESTKDRLAQEVQKLLDEGIAASVVRAAVERWGSRKDAGFAWLPYMVTDVMRSGEGGLVAAIKEARKTWDMAPLAVFGHKWVAPDLPDGIRSAAQARAFMRQRKSEWLNRIEAHLGESTA